MLTLIFAATALAGEPVTQKETLPAGQNATTVFAKTTPTKVGTIKSGTTSYELRCGTVSNAKTCSAYDGTGKVVSTSTSVSTTPSNGFTATFPGTFTPKSVTYEVKK
jgi:hypothetical protein